MHFHTVAALAASITAVSAIRGFNTGSLALDGSAKQESNFQSEFSNQRLLKGTDGAFTAARLYTMIQGGTDSSPISAIPAAKSTNTKLMLGLWASGGASGFAKEITALKSAIQQYPYLGDLATGISVGSEDLYRVTEIGQENDPGSIGAGPEEIANYIAEVRKVIAGTSLAKTPVGHVDTWTSWVNSSNSATIDACDFVGMNGFPYFQTQNTNPIEDGGQLLYKAVSDTQAAVGSKPVWVTETGWPTTGPLSGQAIASLTNARTYWKAVYCTMPAGTPLFWYDQSKDNVGDAANFGVTGATLSPTPLYDLSCDDFTLSSSKTSSVSHSATASHAVASSTATSSGGSGSGSGHLAGSASASGSGSDETSTKIKTASDSEETGSSGSASSGASASGHVSGSGSKSTASATGPLAVYPTAAASGMTTVGAAAGSGAASSPAPTSTLTSYQGNSASGMRSTLALLAVPALLALML